MTSNPFTFAALRRALLGPPRSPMEKASREQLALAAFLAWVGLGADGLSSANYGPEGAYTALLQHPQLALYVAAMTAATVFIIAIAYVQVIELFPNGGGGYRIATQLIGPNAGVVSGSAVIIDYVLTITISIAAGVDALLSLAPPSWQVLKIPICCVAILALITLNLRGVKESVTILMPLFIGFIVTHAGLIIWGILAHADRLPGLLPSTVSETTTLAEQTSWLFVVSALLKAYSHGAGTYTGIEAVADNARSLAEPKVHTGRLAMMYMASSLAVIAAGLIMLYLLWDVRPVEGQTLNAVAFRAVMANWQIGGFDIGFWVLSITMLFAAVLLFVAANTGILGGPAVIAAMATDKWMPHQFSSLSSRLVTQNGVLVMGVAAIIILFVTAGQVGFLVVLYAINVFLTFTLTLYGLCKYWIRQRGTARNWLTRLALSVLGCAVTGGILAVTVFEKFREGAWLTLVITGCLVGLCFYIRQHYREVGAELAKVDALYEMKPGRPPTTPPEPQLEAPTAVFLVGRSLGTGMHSVLWVNRLFPRHYKNYVFISVGEVDSHAFDAEAEIERLRQGVDQTLGYFIQFAQARGIAAVSYQGFGTDVVEELTTLGERVTETYPNAVFFASKLIFGQDNWFTSLLHNQTAIALQRRLHLRGIQMMILPMKVG